MRPLFVVDKGMLDDETRQVLWGLGYAVIELHQTPTLRSLPVVLTEKGEQSAFMVSLRVWWARLWRRA